MNEENVKFFNKYLQVLKSKFDAVLNDSLTLETQLMIAKETIEELQKRIELLEKKNSRTSKTTKEAGE